VVCDILRTSISCFFQNFEITETLVLVLEHPQKTTGFHEMAGKRTSFIEGYFLRFFENYEYI
jgi:hypothetical protein